MTGELTLTGEVLPIGGVREKVIAARRGAQAADLPRGEPEGPRGFPDDLKEGLTARLARRYQQVYEAAIRQ